MQIRNIIELEVWSKYINDENTTRDSHDYRDLSKDVPYKYSEELFKAGTKGYISFTYNVKTDSLPTRFNVSRRGIDIDSIMCAICDNGVETSRHLFFYCCMVRQIVRKITRWWDVPYVEVESYEDWYNWLVNLRISSMHKQMFEGVVF
ncbi:RNA-directed DNA polymerase, eukaryota [Tanacetum coccineum]|uniref:RNA-directed DNA polymerase, eukaryota n=1 Tax=Tanacetum coccineum TaxID=301880 RepID=A0ABQ5D3Q2_9ASTR